MFTLSQISNQVSSSDRDNRDLARIPSSNKCNSNKCNSSRCSRILMDRQASKVKARTDSSTDFSPNSNSLEEDVGFGVLLSVDLC